MLGRSAILLNKMADASAASQSIKNYLAPLLLTLGGLAVVVWTFFLVVGGIHYMTSAGKPDKLEHAKKVIRNALIGLVIEKVDRHVRNLHDAVETHDWLISDENKQVHFVKDSLVLHKNSRSQEWLNWGIRVVMAKNYIDNLREEAMKGWAEKLCYSDNFSLIAVTTSGRMTSIKWPLPDNS